MDENLSLMMVPYKPKEIPDSTDLNIAPLNWLRPIGSTIRPPQKKSKEKRSKKTKMKSSIVANHYLKSHFMGSSQKTLNGVNAVADADTIKNLIKLGKTSETVSMMIHRIDNTLFLDDFDIKTELLDKNSSSHLWFKSILTNILCKGQNYNQVEAEFLACISRLSGPELRSILSLESKFLYHSLPQILPNGEESFQSGECELSGCFLQNNLWQFRNLSFLCGSDIPIFGNSNHPAVTLKLTEKQEINVLTGIDYWLENLMFSVPEVVMCFHSKGIVQNYERIRTEDIPKAAGFDPELVKDTAQSILAFLNSNCTEPGHTYWLFKEKQDDVVKLYDLSSLCEKKKPSPNQKSDENPYLHSVASLLLKLVSNLEKEELSGNLTEAESRENRNNITRLLNQALSVAKTIPDVYSVTLKKLAYHVSRTPLPIGSDKSKKRGNRNEIKKMKGQSTKDNKIQLAGATCELTTDDVTKINQNDALSLLKSSTNGEASSGTAGLLNTKWIAPAIEMIIEGMNDLEEKGSSDLSSLIDPLLLSSANLFKTIIQTNLMELDNHQRLAVGLFILKLLLYSEPDSNDQNQIDTKMKNWTEILELITDLQVPLMSHFSYDETIELICKKSDDLNCLNKFLKSIHEEVKERKVRAYHASSYEDILRFYEEIKDHVPRDNLNRKIGNVYNEMGKKHIDSLILKSIQAGDEGEDPDEIKTPAEYDHIAERASDALLTACERFSKSGDQQNYALCQANMGRLMRVKSRCRVEKNPNEISIEEENDLRQSIIHYQKAVDLVANKADLMPIYESLVWDLISVKIQLSSLYQEMPPLSRYSRKEIEKKFLDLLESADKLGNQIIKVQNSNERFHLRLGELNYRIAAMHHGHIVESDIENKQLLYSVKLSHKYYMKCMTYFAYVDWSRQTDEWCFLFLRATIELSALIKNSNPEKSKNKFLESFRPLITVLPALERLTSLNPKTTNPVASTVKKVLQQSLMELNKSKTEFSNKKEILEISIRSGETVSELVALIQKIKYSLSA